MRSFFFLLFSLFWLLLLMSVEKRASFRLGNMVPSAKESHTNRMQALRFEFGRRGVL